MKTVAALVLAFTVAASGSSAAGPSKPSVWLTGGIVSSGDRIVLHVSGALPGRRLRLYLLRYPLTMTAPPVAIGAVVPDWRGRGQLSFRVPQLAVDVYVPAACCSRGDQVMGRGLLSISAVAPAGFGPLGAAGCAPASPRNSDGIGLAQGEVFATAVGAQLWAMNAARTSDDQATLDGVVATQTKIVFRMTSGVPSVFYAVAPDGTRVPPLWGPSPHLGSNWNRPGAEWGAGFVFTGPGCWQIHAGTPPAQGDFWILIRS